MTSKMSFFNMLQDTDLSDKIGYFFNDYSPSYVKDGREFVLNAEFKQDDKASFKIVDPNLSWNISTDGLRLKKNIRLDHPEILFGEKGIADNCAVLGLAVICTSTVSDRLEAFRMCTFSSSQTSLECGCEISLSAGKYRGNTVLKTVIYLEEDDGSNPNFPKQSGTILGELDRFNVMLFDNKALFPVYEVQSPGSPPWWVVCDWSDIEEDPFISEYVAIVINRSGEMYSQLSLEEGNAYFNPGYLAEVMSSAIQTIIEKAKESVVQWSRIMSDATFAEGTIAYMIQYMRTTLEWDFSSPEITAKSIRSYVYSKLVPQ